MYKGIFFLFVSTFFWGIPQPLLFNEIKHISALEIVSHRAIWSFIFLFFGIAIIGKFYKFINVFNNPKIIFSLFITSFLITCNWMGFVIAIVFERLQDASLGYYISPLISIGLGYVFLKEDLSKSNIISIILMFISIFLLVFSYGNVPYLAILIGLTWATYGLIRKKIDIDAEIGLLFESGVISLISLPYLIFLIINNNGSFYFSGQFDSSLLILTGLFTIIPLFFFNIGVKYLPLGFAGVIFFLTPTFHLLTSFFILKEEITNVKFIAFVIIWFAIFLFINEKIKKNYLE